MDINLNIFKLREAYETGCLSVADVIAYVYDRIEAYKDPAVWINLYTRDEVLKQAESLGDKGLPLFGIPFAIKDNIDSLGFDTTAACPAYTVTPAEDASVVKKLKEAGALLIGRTNMDQFATGLVGVRSPHGAPRCVFDEDYVSGGSSSGSAVAVAAGLVSFSLGTDTAGSGRVPASYNNIVGIKPTKGLISAAGVVPACRSLDCVSVFAGSCAEGDLVRSLLEGVDERDPWTRPGVSAHLPLSKPVVGVLADDEKAFYGDSGAASIYEDVLTRAKDLGWELREFNFAPFREAAQLLYQGPWVAERQAAVGDFIASNKEKCDATVAEIISGAPALSARDAFEGIYKLQAFKATCDKEFEGLDFVLLPTTGTHYKVEDVLADPIKLNSTLGHYTNFFNLLDYAGVAIPAGFRDGRPWGVTLAGPAFSDASLARLADMLHRTMKEGARVGNTDFEVSGDFVSPNPKGMVELAVVGAHLRGMPLNFQLTDRGAELVEATKTAKDYKLFALKGSEPAKPGLAKVPGFDGDGIEIEIWRIGEKEFGSFTNEVPPPLAIGNLETQDGRIFKSFVCEGYALEDAEDITAFGGWRAYWSSM